MDLGTVNNIKNKKKSKKSRKNATRKKLKYIESLGGAILPPIPPRTYLQKQQSDEPLPPSTLVVEPASQVKEIQQQEQQVDALATTPILPMQNEVNTEIQEIPVATDANANANANASVGDAQPAVVTDANANATASVGDAQPAVVTDANANANASVGDAEPAVQKEKVTEKEDPIKTIKATLMEQIRQIEEKTNEIKSQIMSSETAEVAPAAAAAEGGAFNNIKKKRKKTFYKKYKSKISMKRRNKTSRNN